MLFRSYQNNNARYRQCFAGDLYLTGDLARCNADGYFWNALGEARIRLRLAASASAL